MSDMNGINDRDRHANEEPSVNSFKNRLDEYLADTPDMDS